MGVTKQRLSPWCWASHQPCPTLNDGVIWGLHGIPAPLLWEHASWTVATKRRSKLYHFLIMVDLNVTFSPKCSMKLYPGCHERPRCQIFCFLRIFLKHPMPRNALKPLINHSQLWSSGLLRPSWDGVNWSPGIAGYYVSGMVHWSQFAGNVDPPTWFQIQPGDLSPEVTQKRLDSSFSAVPVRSFSAKTEPQPPPLPIQHQNSSGTCWGAACHMLACRYSKLAWGAGPMAAFNRGIHWFSGIAEPIQNHITPYHKA